MPRRLSVNAKCNKRPLHHSKGTEDASEEEEGRVTVTRDLRRGLRKASLPLESAFTSTSAAEAWHRDDVIGECRAYTAPIFYFRRGGIEAIKGCEGERRGGGGEKDGARSRG
jgi:hypothetical protein